MTPAQLAWRSVTRQPARAVLGIVGITAVGALLFDMLMLSGGLSASFRTLIDSIGYDVRVTATEALPYAGPHIQDAGAAAEAILALPEVDAAVGVRGESGYVVTDRAGVEVFLVGFGTDARRTYTVAEGADIPRPVDPGDPVILLNEQARAELGVDAGDRVRVRGRCGDRDDARPAVEMRVAGIARFAFESETGAVAAADLVPFARLCGEAKGDVVDFFMVASAPGASADGAVAAIRRSRPDLHPFSNEQFVRRFQRTEFSYFRIISFVLSTITLFFALLLIASLLTVSVNQRLAEVATLRAIGFRRGRVARDLLWESALLVGIGGFLALPVGGVVAWWLDTILRGMPDIPRDLHFFVFRFDAVVRYAVLMAVTGVLAAAYPMFLATRLPIAATLRKEVVS